MDLGSSRISYERGTLDEAGVGRDPVERLRVWIDEARAGGVDEPNAMCLATADAGGLPSARIVLLRGLDARGLAFYTSYFSRKGRELESNPHAAATFYWPALQRQVRVEGGVERLGEDESDAYFASRPRGSRLAAWASEQSEPIEDRVLLDERVAHFEQRFAGEEVERPHSWGGYLIVPQRIEFWQGRENRLHDRLVFERDGTAWDLRRLQP
ncbi:MAG TPA: pyridoxamine 5'-phosphate oxidase [Candidatus Baltobacteraceae bacterium]|jgi:pyridoxamine 5'-phosphate oxidase